jgi:hypothetical protein
MPGGGRVRQADLTAEPESGRSDCTPARKRARWGPRFVRVDFRHRVLVARMIIGVLCRVMDVVSN